MLQGLAAKLLQLWAVCMLLEPWSKDLTSQTGCKNEKQGHKVTSMDHLEDLEEPDRIDISFQVTGSRHTRVRCKQITSSGS